MSSTYVKHPWLELMDETVALAARESFTIPALAAHLGVSNTIARGVVARLRHQLAEDRVNIVCRPQGKGEPWRYELVGDMADAENWRSVRVRSLKAQLGTVRDVANSMMNATPEASPEGRTVRFVLLQVDHLLDGIAYLEA